MKEGGRRTEKAEEGTIGGGREGEEEGGKGDRK